MPRLPIDPDFPAEDWTCDGGCGRPTELHHPPAWEHDGATLCASCALDVVWGTMRLLGKWAQTRVIPVEASTAATAHRMRYLATSGRGYREQTTPEEGE